VKRNLPMVNIYLSDRSVGDILYDQPFSFTC
jgi:hypothetical protein